LVTAIVVIVASYAGLPVSTTHVSVGTLFGIAMATRAAKLRTVATILVAWVTTLPLAASIAAADPPEGTHEMEEKREALRRRLKERRASRPNC
jgi:mannitol-specific phosphotransferase system IIBC component